MYLVEKSSNITNTIAPKIKALGLISTSDWYRLSTFVDAKNENIQNERKLSRDECFRECKINELNFLSVDDLYEKLKEES